MEARHQAQIIVLMADLGIEGERMPDGRFQTANGEVLGITATAATGAGGEWWCCWISADIERNIRRYKGR